MRDDFGVGIGAEFITRSNKFLLKLGVILHYSVMHYAYRTGYLRVGVSLRGIAVGGPPGVSDAE